MTNEELLKKWNDGGEITTVSMSSYERVIQDVAMMFLSYMEQHPRDYEAHDKLIDGTDEDKDAALKAWREYQTEMRSAQPQKKYLETTDVSYAQFGAATNAAGVYHRHGHEEALKMVDADRLIKMKKLVK